MTLAAPVPESRGGDHRLATSTTRIAVLNSDHTEFGLGVTVVERTHFQVIWLLAKGRTVGERAEITAISERWVNKLSERYARYGAAALGDLRRGNRGARPLLSEADLEALRARLQTPPDDGGHWNGPKAARWIAAHLGLEHAHAPRGWEALKKLRWSIQAPRPRNPKAASVEEEEAFKKRMARPVRKGVVAEIGG
jgi:transposase